MYFLVVLRGYMYLFFNRKILLFICYKHPLTWAAGKPKRKFSHWFNYNMLLLKILNLVKIDTFFFNHDKFLEDPHVYTNVMRNFLKLKDVYYGPYKEPKIPERSDYELPPNYEDLYKKILRHRDNSFENTKVILPEVEPKANDKCYCLSGKKYKKCICNKYIK